MMNKIKKIILGPIIILLIWFLHTKNIHIKCIIHELTGFYCPGCGITRCIISLMHLDFYQAFRYNPAIFIFLPFLIPYLLYIYIIYIFGLKDEITKKIPKIIWYIIIVALLLFGILRNFDMFSFLQPITIK